MAEDPVKTLLAEVLQIPLGEITDDLTMQSHDAWDSLRHMEIVAALEQTYGLELTFEEIISLGSVAGIRALLVGKGVAH